MNEHAGPASALSVLIVGIFAVLLHDKNPPAAPPRPTVSSPGLASIPPSPADRPAMIDHHAQRATIEAPPPIVPAPSGMIPTAEIRPAPSPAPRASPRPGPIPRSRPAPKPEALRPRRSTTIVEPGETLAGVAARIYGTPEAAESIWKANRDQVADRDSALTGGMLLRTP